MGRHSIEIQNKGPMCLYTHLKNICIYSNKEDFFTPKGIISLMVMNSFIRQMSLKAFVE